MIFMKNLESIKIAFLTICSVGYTKPVTKKPLSLKSLIDFKISNLIKNPNDPIGSDPFPTPPPLRIGKVKFTFYKGTFIQTENGWDYEWTKECTKNSVFFVLNADSEEGGEVSPNTDCVTVINGRLTTISSYLFGAEGKNVVLDTGEPARKLTAYALFSYANAPTSINDPALPLLPTQIFASENRPTGTFLMVSRPALEINCEGTFPPGAPVPSPTLKDHDSDDNFTCTAKWNEVFRVTAEIED
jgi:hypothetical protein